MAALCTGGSSWNFAVACLTFTLFVTGGRVVVVVFVVVVFGRADPLLVAPFFTGFALACVFCSGPSLDLPGETFDLAGGFVAT